MPAASPHPARPLRPTRLALALGLVLALTGAARAESLKDVYEAARGYDATYLAAKALADSAQYKFAQSESLLRPSAAFNATAQALRANAPGTGNLEQNNTALELTGRQPLFNRANAKAVEQSRKALEAAGTDLQAAEQDLIVRVAQAYFDVLGAQNALATTQANKAFISEQLASAKRNFEVGTATITDTREAQARFDLAMAQEIAADNDLRAKKIALDQLVGRSGVEPKGLAVPVVLPAVNPPVVDEWVMRADGQHPAVRKATLALEAARLETEKAQAGHLPTVDAVASLSSRRIGPDTQIPGTTNTASLGVQLTLPLFAGYSIQNRVKETLVLEEKSRNDLESARRGVAQNTRVAFFGVQSLQAQVKALEAAESSSQLALEATQLGYKVGVRVNLDVLNAQTQLFTTRRDLAKARYDTLVNSLRLRQASGALTPEDLDGVNQLLAP